MALFILLKGLEEMHFSVQKIINEPKLSTDFIILIYFFMYLCLIKLQYTLLFLLIIHV